MSRAKENDTQLRLSSALSSTIVSIAYHLRLMFGLFEEVNLQGFVSSVSSPEQVHLSYHILVSYSSPLLLTLYS